MSKLAILGGKPIRKKFLIFGSPKIEEDEIKDVVDSLKSGWISTGPKVHKFEEMFREYIGSKYAIAVNSCTAGLHLSMIVSGIKKGDEVITTPLTFAATANSIIHAGATPVFADVELPSMNISPAEIEKKISSKTKAIIVVHLAGRPCKMDEIMEVAKNNNILLIEDAAHAIETKYNGKKIGNIADISSFSFYATKNITTGEGGMVTTNNKLWAEKIRSLAFHGLTSGAWKRYSDKGFKHYQVIFPGFKYNMMDIQAAIGIRQLKKINFYLKKREKIWRTYNTAFKSLPVVLPADPEPNTVHARHLYTILLDLNQLKVSRNKIQQALFKENIGTGIHFISLHLHEYYKKTFNYKETQFPNAKFISDRTISLPLSPKLSNEDVQDVISAVEKVITYYER